MHTNHASFDLDTQIITQDNARSYCLYLLRHVRECFLSDEARCVMRYAENNKACLEYRVRFSNGKHAGSASWNTRNYNFSDIQMRDVYKSLWSWFEFWLVHQWKMSLEPFDDVLAELEPIAVI